MIPKPIKIVSKKIRNSAKGQNCTLRIPGVCNHNPETVVLCHVPTIFGGMATKSGDIWGFYGCSDCHSFADGGYVIKGWNRKDILIEIYRAMVESQMIFYRKALIQVK